MRFFCLMNIHDDISSYLHVFFWCVCVYCIFMGKDNQSSLDPFFFGKKSSSLKRSQRVYTRKWMFSWNTRPFPFGFRPIFRGEVLVSGRVIRILNVSRCFLQESLKEVRIALVSADAVGGAMEPDAPLGGPNPYLFRGVVTQGGSPDPVINPYKWPE